MPKTLFIRNFQLYQLDIVNKIDAPIYHNHMDKNFIITTRGIVVDDNYNIYSVDETQQDLFFTLSQIVTPAKITAFKETNRHIFFRTVENLTYVIFGQGCMRIYNIKYDAINNSNKFNIYICDEYIIVLYIANNILYQVINDIYGQIINTHHCLNVQDYYISKEYIYIIQNKVVLREDMGEVLDLLNCPRERKHTTQCYNIHEFGTASVNHNVLMLYNNTQINTNYVYPYDYPTICILDSARLFFEDITGNVYYADINSDASFANCKLIAKSAKYFYCIEDGKYLVLDNGSTFDIYQMTNQNDYIKLYSIQGFLYNELI